jgi:hypothetical protein
MICRDLAALLDSAQAIICVQYQTSLTVSRLYQTASLLMTAIGGGRKSGTR